jgi:hypothetical protein
MMIENRRPAKLGQAELAIGAAAVTLGLCKPQRRESIARRQRTIDTWPGYPKKGLVNYGETFFERRRCGAPVSSHAPSMLSALRLSCQRRSMLWE